MGRLLAWLDERTGAVSRWRSFADQPVRGGVRLRHVFPAVVAFLFVQQAVLGVAMAAYYAPSATDAWASTAYLHDQVTMGWLVRGMHYHGASVLVVVSALWILELVVHRGYRGPREFLWWMALGIGGLSMALGVTGNPLPWDQEGFWSIQVELGIAEQGPGGEVIHTLVEGGSQAGNFTVLRLFVLHAFVLPLVLLAMLAVAIRQLRRHGAPPPAGMPADEADRRARPYFPGQMLLDLLAISVAFGAVVFLTMSTHGAELMGPADPTPGFQARPAWYFMFLYKLRMMLEGPLEPVATMVIPGLATGFLVAIPFIDRYGGRLGRVVVLAGIGVLATGVVGLTGLGVRDDRADEDYQKAVAVAMKEAARAVRLAREGVQPQGGLAVYWNDPEYKVKLLYKEHCQNCHTVAGIGGDEAPNLSDYSSRAWLSGLVRDASAPKYFGGTKHDEMDPYPESDLPDDQLQATVEYLVSLMGDDSMKADAALAAKGKTLWEDELECSNCHEVEAGSDGDGPNLLGHGSKAWVERVIRDSSKPDLFGKDAEMPKFEGKLSDEEIGQLATFVIGQRAERSSAAPPGRRNDADGEAGDGE